MEMKKFNRRCRKPFAEKTSEILQRFDVFKRSRGSCNHFNRFDISLMKKTIKAEEALEDFLGDYVLWIEENIDKKERYLPLN
jgi:hypothetical protein